MSRDKRLVRESSTRTINHATGEIEDTSSYKTTIIEQEPEFVKLYVQDIIKLTNLPMAANGVLYTMLKYMTYDNLLVLNPYIKEQIAKINEIKPNTLSHTLTKLVNEGILSRVATGTYMVNPDLFGRGKWQDIRNLRLTIHYGHDGKKFMCERNLPEQLSMFKELSAGK